MTEFNPIFVLVMLVLGIISASMITLKKFLDYKSHEDGRKYALEGRINKIEWVLKNILQRVDDIDIFLRNREIEKIELEVMAIRGVVKHQLGHMKYFRCMLK